MARIEIARPEKKNAITVAMYQQMADAIGAAHEDSWVRARYDPGDPIWPNRDRFVLSAGHASMLLYSMLHLAGVKAVDPDYEVLGNPSVSLDDIKSFRQIDSR